MDPSREGFIGKKRSVGETLLIFSLIILGLIMLCGIAVVYYYIKSLVKKWWKSRRRNQLRRRYMPGIELQPVTPRYRDPESLNCYDFEFGIGDHIEAPVLSLPNAENIAQKAYPY